MKRELQQRGTGHWEPSRTRRGSGAEQGAGPGPQWRTSAQGVGSSGAAVAQGGSDRVWAQPPGEHAGAPNQAAGLGLAVQSSGAHKAGLHSETGHGWAGHAGETAAQGSVGWSTPSWVTLGSGAAVGSRRRLECPQGHAGDSTASGSSDGPGGAGNGSCGAKGSGEQKEQSPSAAEGTRVRWGSGTAGAGTGTWGAQVWGCGGRGEGGVSKRCGGRCVEGPGAEAEVREKGQPGGLGVAWRKEGAERGAGGGAEHGGSGARGWGLSAAVEKLLQLQGKCYLN